ncbi:hypothetical protein [Halonatronum saccharophilum]|uniref:hypothetical protein n=1 Tax=Halonatronum saccharophilum TaxID=150060 RepID=UPI0004811EF1|nr:hypothetical protein [Halonatronum saccharophilum]
MCIIIKNGNFNNGNKVEKVDLLIKDNEVVLVGKNLHEDGCKIVDASKIVSETIIEWFTN